MGAEAKYINKCPICGERIKITTSLESSNNIPFGIIRFDEVYICDNKFCMLWNKGYWLIANGVWENLNEKKFFINVPPVKIEKEFSPNKWRNCWNNLLCKLGKHNYKEEVAVIYSLCGIVGWSRTCEHCRHRDWKAKRE
jgi:hypothetical protein